MLPSIMRVLRSSRLFHSDLLLMEIHETKSLPAVHVFTQVARVSALFLFDACKRGVIVALPIRKHKAGMIPDSPAIVAPAHALLGSQPGSF
jgi:hypothetical protein